MISEKSQLSATAQRWLKVFHICFACAWGGSAASIFAVHCLYNPESGPELFARNLALIHIDNYVIVPSVLGCLVTGLAYSQFTAWGYFRYYWIITKLTITGGTVGVGLFFFIPWLDKITKASFSQRNYLAVDPSFSAALNVHRGMALIQAVVLFVLVLISVFKPWGRKGDN